jgi:hypothetical protein
MTHYTLTLTHQECETLISAALNLLREAKQRGDAITTLNADHMYERLINLEVQP